MSQNNNHLPRRQILRNGLIGSMVLLAGVGVLFGKSISAEGQDANSRMGTIFLINALRSTGNAVCLNAAERLEASRASKVEYDLRGGKPLLFKD